MLQHAKKVASATMELQTEAMGVQEAITAINGLNKDQQLELVGKVWESLAIDAPSPEWHRQVIHQRLAEENASVVKGDSWENVQKRIRARL